MTYTEFSEVVPRPAEVPAGEPHGCIGNALDAALYEGWRYAEGIAKSARSGFWYRHAWNLDDEGRVIDVTWEQPGERYIGRVVPVDEKCSHVAEREGYWFYQEQPLVPVGELGFDCLTEREDTWLKEQMAGE